jgi:adenylate cyclase
MRDQTVRRPTILIVDDNPANVDLLVDLLAADYQTKVATNGARAIHLAKTLPLDLILLDVMMPEVSGYEVCEQLKADTITRDIPVIFVTAMGEAQDETKGFRLGAIDYVTKPISPPVVRARINTHLTLAALMRQQRLQNEQLARQADELMELNQTLEARVAAGVEKVERLGRLKRFFSPAVVDLLVSSDDDPLKSRRREITAVFVDLRGFTAFTETAEPEDVMQVLGEYHEALGRLVLSFNGTLERFSGDGIMIFFNDPVVLENPCLHAVQMAIAMQERFRSLARGWTQRGFSLSMGVGIAQGYATIGAIGFEGRRDYGAIGTVNNLAARLCDKAGGGQILVSQRVFARVESSVLAETIGALDLKGFHRPVPAFTVLGLLDDTPMDAQGH